MTAQSKLLGLLDYIEQVERMKSKPAFSVPSDFFVGHEHEIRSLPDVEVNQQMEGDDVWLRIPRLQEITPPPPDATLSPWVKLSRTPEKLPELLAEATIAGETIRLSGAQGIRELFDWYVEFLWSP